MTGPCAACRRVDDVAPYRDDAGPLLCWACGVSRADAAAQSGPPAETVDGPSGRALAFVSAVDLGAVTPSEPEWVWEGYAARGAVTLQAGKPKSGKSTIACALTDAVSAGAGAFLGRRVTEGAVVYVSEEGAGTLVHKLPASDRVRVLTRDAAWPKPTWPTLIAAAVAEAKHVGAVLLVIDALSFWAGFAEGQEKDAGSAQAVMNALAAATAAGLAVLVVHHQRKAGGEDGDAVRGSGAIFGAADVLLEVERAGEDAPPTQRRLVSTGRWPQAAPVLLADRDPASGAWRVIGEAAGRFEAAGLGARERILQGLPEGGDGTTEGELAQVLGLDPRKIGKPLRELVDDGLIDRSGGGRRGDPYRYTRAADDSPPDSPPGEGRNAPMDSPPPCRGGASNRESPRSPGGETGSNGAKQYSDDELQALIDAQRAAW